MGNTDMKENYDIGINGDINGNDDKKKKKIIAIIVAIVLVLAAVIGFFIWNSAITAVTMRIQRLVGTVNLYNEDGSEQSLREKMRLGAGQIVTTAGESLIMVSLDDTKLMTMEETSKAEIKTRGKKLLFNLIEGNLFFNVTEKLADNESFDITTTTMVCGIRGTSAYVGRDPNKHEILMTTDGLVHVVATNPRTKESLEVDVPAGQKITIYLDDEAEGDKTISIVMEPFKEEDLPAMALDTIRKSPALMDRIAKATGFSTKKLITLAELSSTKGTSMYGSAADTLKASGIEDAIPFMGDRSQQMVTSANSAFNIAKDDLPLEVAIIQGYRDVMDVGVEAGYDSNNMATLMDGTRAVMEDTFTIIDEAGVRSIDKINAATRISNTLKVSAGRMSRANLSTGEIAQVLEAEDQLFTGAANDAAGSSSDGSKSGDIISALDKVGDHVTGTVDEEMDKSSNGEETVIALLGSGSGQSSRSSVGDTDDDIIAPANNTDDTNSTVADANGNGTAAGEAAGGANSNNKPGSPNTGSSGPKTRSGDYAPTNDMTKPGFAVATNASDETELRNAHNAIAVTDPNTGVVALNDGTLFDPTYYGVTNPDVVTSFGTSTDALLAHYLRQGRAQGRKPIDPNLSSASNQTKPDWLLRQEQEEREAAALAAANDHDDDDDDDDSNKNSGPTPIQPDGQGNYALGNGITGSYNGGVFNITRPQGNNNTVALPVRVVDNNSQVVDVTSAEADLGVINWGSSQNGVQVTGSNDVGNPGIIIKNSNNSYTLKRQGQPDDTLDSTQLDDWIKTGHY